MTSFVNYLVESGISLSLFALVYFLLLRRETFFNVNRWFLLVSVIFSAVLPLIHIPVYSVQPAMLPEVTVTPYVNLLSAVTVYATGLTSETEQFVLSNAIFGWVYLGGLLLFLIRFSWQLAQIVRLISRNKVVAEGDIKLVLLEKDLSPFSFLNYVFVGQGFQNKQGWENMLEHERQHILQRHTYDVLILEIIAVFQWFNPFFWLFRRALRENHEFLADQAVLARGAKPAWYKQTLINQYVGDQIVLTNNFNYSLIKIRIKMMSKIKSGKIALSKISFGVLTAVALTVSFAFQQDKLVAVEDASASPQDKLVTVEAISPSKTVTIQFDGKPLSVSGDAATIEKLKRAIAQSNAYEVVENVNTGGVVVTAISVPITRASSPPPSQNPSVYKTGSGEDELYFYSEQMPQFPGGESQLLNFIAQNVHYPTVAQQNGKQGKVNVTFVVEKDGSVGNAKVVRPGDPSLDTEAVRVVMSMPKWLPGKNGGKPVRVAYTLPVNFVLQ